MSSQKHLINSDLKGAFPLAVKGEGVYLYDRDGKRYLDGCGGALVATFGHGVSDIAQAMTAQAESLAYVYRFHFSSPVAEELAARFCHLTKVPMGMAFFTNSGSEATEMAVKLARIRHLAAGEKSRYKIISRWQSYHGITMGALSWSGFTGRRADYEPYLLSCVHIPPAYCYRCWFRREPDTCGLECAHSLEDAILTEGAETVAAFIAEPIAGSALAAACPPAEYFRVVRSICDRHGVLFIAEEVMTGAGRTGGSFFASDHFPGRPDIIVFGKGVGGGYYPLAGVLISRDAAETLTAGIGVFTAGQSHSGHPVGMAAGLAALNYMDKHKLLARAAENGEYLGQRLKDLEAHSMVGDVRGRGLMWGLEFVQDKETKRTFDPARKLHLEVYEAGKKLGLILLPSGGCDRGHAGDMALIGPPLIITREQIDEMVEILERALTEVEKGASP
ncbi:MAG: aminotransferase class III-fold pyridoxal phosphate-dependent enzyme [Desulfobacterota bacterium]|nr:aminotransferase class III-fold pyridoxal phosphate-dependent enzyme [Thermodesulfobacteriota bacterium]